MLFYLIGLVGLNQLSTGTLGQLDSFWHFGLSSVVYGLVKETQTVPVGVTNRENDYMVP